MAVPRKSSTSRGPKFKTVPAAKAPRTGKDGGHYLGTPTHCPAKRAHGNVRSGY